MGRAGAGLGETQRSGTAGETGPDMEPGVAARREGWRAPYALFRCADPRAPRARGLTNPALGPCKSWPRPRPRARLAQGDSQDEAGDQRLSLSQVLEAPAGRV